MSGIDGESSKDDIIFSLFEFEFYFAVNVDTANSHVIVLLVVVDA